MLPSGKVKNPSSWVSLPITMMAFKMLSNTYKSKSLKSTSNHTLSLQQIRNWIKGTGKRVKTDRQDALMLAMYGTVQNPPTWNPLPEVVSQLESLLKRLDDFKDILRQEENRLQSWETKSNKHFVEMHRWKVLTNEKGNTKGILGGVRGNNPLKDFYQRLVGRCKPKKVALTAAARKIVVWCWTVFIKGEAFDPNLCYAH